MIVSAPFGNYHEILKRVTRTNFTPTLGTFTLSPRGFFTKPYGGRWTRVLLTLRYSYFLDSWINKIGLKNNGIKSCEEDVSNKIVSIHGFDRLEWSQLAEIIATMKPKAVELNVSCPNVGEYYMDVHLFATIIHYLRGVDVIVKLPPVGYKQIAFNAYLGGIRLFHACNTIPTKKGGISGKALQPLSLEVVHWLRKEYKDVYIIGGGGITCKEDVIKFKQMGADEIAIGTMLFNPFNWRKVSGIVEG